MRKVIGWTGIILILLAVFVGLPCALWGISWTSVFTGICVGVGVAIFIAVFRFFIYLIE